MTVILTSVNGSFRLAGCGLLLPILVSVCFAGGDLRLLSGGREHVVFPDEAGRIRLGTTAASVAWTIHDFEGSMVASGTESAPGGFASIAVPVREPGYYTIDLSAGEHSATASTSWAIVRRSEQLSPASSPFGVMTHFAQGWDVEVIPVMKKGGIVNARDEAYWKFVEAKRGIFTFPGQFDAYMEEFTRCGIATLMPLTFENPDYDGGQTPYTSEAFDGYARYAEKVVEHYGTSLKAVEIWNEYNGSFAKGPAADARTQTYVAMLKRAYSALKHAQPSVTVVGGSTINIPLHYFEEMFQNGALTSMDAVSVHPYRYTLSPEGLETEIFALGELIDKYSPNVHRPIWITEIGWPVRPNGGPGDPELSEATQAKYLARAFSLCLAGGAEQIYWYLLRDYADFPSMGLLRDDHADRGRYTPKPSFVAYSVISRHLAGARFVRRDATAPNIYSLLFNKGGESVRVMWALEPAAFTLRANGPVRLSSLVGKDSVLVPIEGKITVPLSDAPCYAVGGITPLPPPLTNREIIADSARDFSGTQGEKGWFYGIYGGAAGQADPFQAMPTYRSTDYGTEWADAAPYAIISATAVHPGTFSGGNAAPTVRRWVSSFKGIVTAAGELTRLSNLGDGVNAAVYVDGVSVYTHQLGGGQPLSIHFSVNIPTRVGTKIDFVIGPGPRDDVSYDQTRFSATLSHE